MPDYTYTSGSEGLNFEDKYLMWSDMGLPNPSSPYTAEIWSFGLNSLGQLATNDNVNRSSPVQIGASPFNISKFNQGTSQAGYVATNGTLWMWGQNSFGNLGDGTITVRSSPIQIGLLTNWSKIYPGYTTFGIKIDSSLWGWGYNTNGQLGDGTNTGTSSPNQIGLLTNWSTCQSGVSFSGTSATKLDGSLWGWGTNSSGNIGVNDTIHRSSPVQVGSLTNWKRVLKDSHTVALKTDGTLWSWGSNSPYGNLGDGTIVDKSSPVQIGTNSNWVDFSTGQFINIARTSSGLIYTWGINIAGNLGDGTLTHRSSPVQIGALTNWNKICANGSGGSPNMNIASIKQDGTLWTWGANANGELGLNDTTHRSSPVQVGALTNWKLLSEKGGSCTFAIKTTY